MPFSFADYFLRCAEAFYFNEVPVVHLGIFSLAARDVLSKKLLQPRSIKEVFACFLLEDFDGFLSYTEVFHPL